MYELHLRGKFESAALFPNPSSYYNHKDQTLLRHVAITFKSFESSKNDIDIDTFQRLILITRGRYIIYE